jgi:hypothetical protein
MMTFVVVPLKTSSVSISSTNPGITIYRKETLDIESGSFYRHANVGTMYIYLKSK